MKLPKTSMDVSIPCVIVATGGCWGHILSYLRSLGSKGISVYIVGVGCDLAIANASKYCAGFACLPTGQDAEVATKLLNWRRGMGWTKNPVLFFVSEKLGGMFCTQRAILEQGFILPIPDPAVLAPLLHKNLSLDVARRAGLLVPQSWEVTSVEQLEDACTNAILPVVIKPLGASTLGVASFKADVVHHRNDLIKLAKSYWLCGSKFIVQQYIPGEDTAIWVYLFYRYKDSNELHEWIGRKLRQSPPGAGIMAMGIAQYNADVASIGRLFVDASGYWGIGGIEFKEYNGSFYFIEMNPRSEGFQSVAIYDGIDFPSIAFDAAIYKKLQIPVMQFDKTAYVDGDYYLGQLKTTNGFYIFINDFLIIFNRNIVFSIISFCDPFPFIRTLLKKIF